MDSLQNFACTRCGSSRCEPVGDLLRCAHCGATYRRRDTPAATVVIQRGANVVIGKGGKVRVGGGLRIEDGARVEVLGELELVAPGTRR